jgi:hypothetical protein
LVNHMHQEMKLTWLLFVINYKNSGWSGRQFCMNMQTNLFALYWTYPRRILLETPWPSGLVASLVASTSLICLIQFNFHAKKSSSLGIRQCNAPCVQYCMSYVHLN